MNKILLFVSSVVLVPIALMILGIYYYGIWGFFVGLALSFLFFKLVSVLAKAKFERRMKALEEESLLLKDADYSIESLQEVSAGEYLEGDDELKALYPTSYELRLGISPKGDSEWKPEGLNVNPVYDEDLIEDDQDEHQAGYGIYLFSVKILENDNKVGCRDRTIKGRANVCIHFGAGPKLSTAKIAYHCTEFASVEIPNTKVAD